MKPIKDGIFFIFKDETSNTAFTNKAKYGVLLVNGQGEQASVARWGTAVAIGPDCDNVQPGDEILIEAGMWTVSFDYAGNKLWKTSQDKVIMVQDAIAN